MFKNWKTTSAGISAIALGIYLILTGNTIEGISSIVTGFVGIFSKDYNIDQTPPIVPSVPIISNTTSISNIPNTSNTDVLPIVNTETTLTNG